MGYNAGRLVGSGTGQAYRTEYQMEAGDLADFKANAGYYEMCANMIYAGGEPDWNVVAFGDMIGKGNFSGAGRQLGNIWASALQSFDFLVNSGFFIRCGCIEFKNK